MSTLHFLFSHESRLVFAIGRHGSWVDDVGLLDKRAPKTREECRALIVEGVVPDVKGPETKDLDETWLRLSTGQYVPASDKAEADDGLRWADDLWAFAQDPRVGGWSKISLASDSGDLPWSGGPDDKGPWFQIGSSDRSFQSVTLLGPKE